MIKELRESQKKGRFLVPYGRLISEIFHQGGILQALSEVNYFTDEKLETETGKVINANTLKNMRLISKVTRLKSDISESRVVSNLMEDFPPICKKDTLAIQMALIADHYETHGKLISLDEVPEEMYGGELPLAKSRKSKRKDFTEEEYLGEEQPAKKAKTSKKEKMSEEGGSGLPTIEEEVEDLDQSRVLCKRTRGGKKAAPSPIQAVRIPKKPRQKAIRKLKYLSEADEESDQEINEMVDEVSNNAARDLVNEAMDIVRKEALDRETTIAAASEVIKASEAVQELTASEVENLILRHASEEPTESKDLEGNPISQSTVAKIVSLGSSSDSPSSSSSTDSDDISLIRVEPSLRNKTPSPSTKPHKKPAIEAFIPVFQSIEARTIAMQHMRIDKCKNLPKNHPLRPPMIDPIQSISASAEGASDFSGTGLVVIDKSVSTPNSPTPTPNNNQTVEQSVISNLESHCSGELPGYQPQMTSDITSNEVVTESPPVTTTKPKHGPHKQF